MTGVSAPEGQLPGLACRPPPELPPFLRLHAQIISDSDKIPCPLYRQKQTWITTVAMSALCQKQTLAVTSGVAREVVALLDDEFEQERCAGFRDGDRVLDRGHDGSGLLNARRGDVEPLGDLGVIAADGQRAVLLGRKFEHVALCRHDSIIEYDGEDGNATASGRLDIHAGHADC